MRENTDGKHLLLIGKKLYLASIFILYIAAFEIQTP